MKKIFTLILALVGLTSVVNAASTIDDVSVCKHSYVLVADDYTGNGTTTRVKGSLFGDNYFLDVTGGSISTGKGNIDLSSADTCGVVTEDIVKKYGEYGKHLNSLRLKNAQDVIAMKVTAGSKLIIFYQNNGGERYPLFGSAADVANNKLDNQGKIMATTNFNKTNRMEWTADDDRTIYIGSQGGDMYVAYIIVEANEAAGTPSVKVGAQTFADGLWYREVTCKPASVTVEGESYSTVCTYTTDGTTPDENSPVYTEPIKCYKDQTVKFQAYLSLGTGAPTKDDICENADNEGVVTFKFDAPTMTVDGAKLTVKSAYEGAKNYISYGDVKDEEMTSEDKTFTESATVSAYSKVVNGTYATFTTSTKSTDVLVLNPIKEEKTIKVTAYEIGDSIVPASGTAEAYTTWYVKAGTGKISADSKDFFVKDLTFAALATADATKAKYQVPAGQEAYIQMSNTNIIFQVAEGDSVDVTVVLTKNACKTINATDDETVTTDRKCYVNVSGTTYGTDDITNGDVANLDGYANTITFGLKGAAGGSTFTFQKYSGTGNILISSINIKPVAADAGVHEISAATAETKTVKCVENGQLVIKSAKGTFTAAGARLK